MTDPSKGYATGVHPLAGYAAIVAVFNLLFAGFLAAVRLRRRPLPERIGAGDIVLFGVATYRVSRLLAKDSVTSFLRAPFTRFEKPIGNGEVLESPRGTGFRHALGELATCPFCLGQWVASFFIYGFVFVPRLTRLIAAMYAIFAISDTLQLARDRVNPAGG